MFFSVTVKSFSLYLVSEQREVGQNYWRLTRVFTHTINTIMVVFLFTVVEIFINKRRDPHAVCIAFSALHEKWSFITVTTKVPPWELCWILWFQSLTWIWPNYLMGFNCSFSGFGGLEVACWPLVPKFAGSNPTEAVGFFRAKKYPQHTFLRRGSKASVPCRRFTACKRSLNVEVGHFQAKFIVHFSPK